LGIKIEDGRSLGFFTAATLQECNESTIKSIQQDKFQLIKLNLLECQIGNKKYKILNDAAILRRPNGKSGRFTVNVGCDNFEAVGDGVIISSPAGSSSYNFSTGGAILSWDLFAYGVRFFNITRGLRSVSLIVPGETITTVVTHYPAFIELDGFGLEIEAETKLTLQLSHEFAQLVCFKYQGQLTRLKKLVRTTALD
jgi:NAD kinase